MGLWWPLWEHLTITTFRKPVSPTVHGLTGKPKHLAVSYRCVLRLLDGQSWVQFNLIDGINYRKFWFPKWKRDRWMRQRSENRFRSQFAILRLWKVVTCWSIRRLRCTCPSRWLHSVEAVALVRHSMQITSQVSFFSTVLILWMQ